MLTFAKGALIGTVLLVAAGAGAQNYQPQKNMYNNRGVVDFISAYYEEEQFIGSDKAAEIAYNHSGLNEKETDCVVLEDKYGDADTYQVHIITDTKEYFYQIDACEGTILNIQEFDAD